MDEIENMIRDGAASTAEQLLDKAIAANGNHADLYFMRGKARWKQGNRGGAISDYEQAIALDPNSPAKAALELARDIMDFYNPDLLNP